MKRVLFGVTGAAALLGSVPVLWAGVWAVGAFAERWPADVGIGRYSGGDVQVHSTSLVVSPGPVRLENGSAAAAIVGAGAVGFGAGSFLLSRAWRGMRD
ncbi:hypothetical protein [Alienimonas californiensis]|uniref:Uncharacterized protein n=1 Tax=Alienimonas californiensis TaxID=2527989 RepID=A0A517P4P8_9PLAN|nr:hypothetical protein [Alienimonas californiensis]QDT14349.1 hypothetical protein CA12_04220 [Alienimonas californiensis]